MIMKNRLAIFDLDGTLFDTRKVNYQAYKYALDKYGVELDYELFASQFNGRLYKTYMGTLMGDVNTSLLSIDETAVLNGTINMAMAVNTMKDDKEAYKPEDKNSDKKAVEVKDENKKD